MGKICYIMGKSSSGKDTIYKQLIEKMTEAKTITLYTTRPIREGETDGVEYYFVDDFRAREMEEKGCIIEMRSYNTEHGVWKYFTADDGRIQLERYHYLVMGTLQSYEAMLHYFGQAPMVPVYIEVEDGMRLQRALDRERMQDKPKYAEMCRRFLADQKDFSEENIINAGIRRRFVNQDKEGCLSEILDYLREECDYGQ